MSTQAREAVTTALELADSALDNARWYIGQMSTDDAAERPLDCLSIALTEIYRAVKALAEQPAPAGAAGGGRHERHHRRAESRTRRRGDVTKRERADPLRRA